MANEAADAPHEPNTAYDVFLSYRMSDTGRTFTGNLYHALRQKRFKTFFIRDIDKKLDSPSVAKAIQQSRISIVVLSENYASSAGCLDDLVTAIECMQLKNHTVWPIFYQVNPSDVRQQMNSYAEAMAKHEERFGQDSEKVRTWRSALSQVAELSGWLCTGSGYEYEVIEKVVESTIKSLSRYDIFLSFSGEDTRYSFTGFLYDALRREGFKTFMDDDGLIGGNEISQSLLRAIEKSRLSIVVFSKNYGYSSWCLDELAKIIECMKTKNQLVWPIFYKVEQSDVCNQTNSYGDAMAAQEKRFGKYSEKVQKWRSALSEVANLKDWHLKTRYEYEFIQKIVEMAIDIEDQLYVPSPARMSTTRKTIT